MNDEPDVDDEELKALFKKESRSALCREVIERAALSLFGNRVPCAQWLWKIREQDPYTYWSLLGSNWATRAELSQLTRMHEWLEAHPTFPGDEKTFAREIYLTIHPQDAGIEDRELGVRLRAFWRDKVRGVDEDILEDGRLAGWCLRGFLYGVVDAYLDFRDAATAKQTPIQS